MSGPAKGMSGPAKGMSGPAKGMPVWRARERAKPKAARSTAMRYAKQACEGGSRRVPAQAPPQRGYACGTKPARWPVGVRRHEGRHHRACATLNAPVLPHAIPA
eukprot:24455-Chlamydomonas_euryale.AAC.6